MTESVTYGLTCMKMTLHNHFLTITKANIANTIPAYWQIT